MTVVTVKLHLIGRMRGGGSVFVFDFIEIVFDCICVFDRIRVFDCISSVLIVSWPPVPGHPHRSGGLLEG